MDPKSRQRFMSVKNQQLRTALEAIRFKNWQSDRLAGGCTLAEVENWFLWEALS